MTKYHKHHRIIATFFLLIFFPTLLPNNLFASNNGPVAPEAASFEPVDSSDMVNLATGDMSYVLPLLNVPSPEGGYPLSLSYHAGIAMDQEASWVGLGWNLNPGAINRNINNTPDDWNNGKSINFAYSNLGKQEVISIGVGVNYKIFNLGLDYTFINGKAKGGIVSFGVGDSSLGINQSIGFDSYAGNYSTSLNAGGATLSASGEGVGVSIMGMAGISYKMRSQEISFQGNSNSVNMGGLGVGYSQTNSTNPHGVNSVSSSFNLALPITNIFQVRFKFSKNEYSMLDSQTCNINGVLYLKDSYKVLDASTKENYKNDYMDANSISLYFRHKTDSRNGGVKFAAPTASYDQYNVSAQGLIQNIQPLLLDSKTLILNSEQQNPYCADDYCVAGFKDRHHIGEKFSNNFMELPNIDENKIHFYPLNTNSSYINKKFNDWSINSSTLNDITNITNSEVVNSTISDGSENYSNYNSVKNRLKKETFTECYTNEQIKNNPVLIIEAGNFNRNNASSFAPKGIGAFKITSVDGKVYHYSLPVYNFETIMRTYKTASGEDNSFIEKVDTQPYATNWLLTAITGPDYIDVNSNGKVDDADYGYWVDFSYGKWSDGYLWKRESVNDKEVSSTINRRAYCTESPNPNTTSRAIGIKQVYYLNSISTRTNKALFIKSERIDDIGNSISKSNTFNDVENALVYNSQYATGIYFTETKYDYNMNISGNFKSLKLDRIVLINKKDESLFQLNNQEIPDNQTNNSINFKTTAQKSNILGQNLGTTEVVLHQRNWIGGTYNSNVYLTKNSNLSLLQSKSIKTFEFNYDNSLSKKDNIGKLSLKSLASYGKNHISVSPPYYFDYYINRDFDKNNYDLWGFDKDYPFNYSLKNIKTPLGSSIGIEYEKDDFSAVLNNFNTNISYNPIAKNFIRTNNGYNGTIEVQWQNPCYTIGQIYKCLNPGNQISVTLSKDSYSPFTTTATVNSVTDNVVSLTFSAQVPSYYTGDFYCPPNRRGTTGNSYGAQINVSNCDIQDELIGRCNDSRGGLRVKNINVIDNNKKSTTTYDYNKPNSTISSGVTASTPYIKNDYSTFFTSGVVYETVTVTAKDNDNNIFEKNIFQFNVLKPNNDYTLNGSNGENQVGNFEASVTATYGDFLQINSNEKIRAIDVLADNSSSNNYVARTAIATTSIIDNTSKIGELLSITKLNSQDQILSKQTFQYSNPFNDTFGTYGEAFKSYRSHKVIPGVSPGGNPVGTTSYEYFVNSLNYKSIPSVLLSTSKTDHNRTITTNYTKYDFLTGQVLETTTKTSDGQNVKTKLIPAYQKYSGMQSKVDNINNKNMLSQITANYAYIFDQNDSNKPWKETSIGITTWSNVWAYKDISGTKQTATGINEKIWRKHKSYIWNGTIDSNGIFTTYDDSFNWSLPMTPGEEVAQNSKWKQISETTLYDHFSAPLEMKNINGNFTSTKMGDNNTKITTNGNARYGEIFYSGAENINGTWLDPEISITSSDQQSSLYSHTGRKSVETTLTSKLTVSMKNLEHTAGKYRVSVWVEKTNADKAVIKLDNTTYSFISDNITAGNWKLKTAYLQIPSGSCNISLSSTDATKVYFDDLMIRPVASSIAGYVYNEWDELTYIIGNNGLATKFEYDAAGRLVKTYSEIIDDTSNSIQGGFKIAKSNTYNNKFLRK
ncbi:hypothetical protein D3C85_375990 [compost metagenome]